MDGNVWTPHPAQPHGGLWYRQNDAGRWQYWSGISARWCLVDAATYWNPSQAPPRDVYRLTWCEPEEYDNGA